MNTAAMTGATILIAIIAIQLIPITCKPILIISKPGDTTPAPVLSTCRDGQYIKVDCKCYIDCYKGGWRRQFCPSNTFWNDDAKKCDNIHNVPDCYKLLQEIKLEPGMRLVGNEPTLNSKPETSEQTNKINSDNRVFAEHYHNSADDGEEYYDYETESEEEVDRAVTSQTNDLDDNDEWEPYVPPRSNVTTYDVEDEFEPEDNPTSNLSITESDNHVKRSPGDIITTETENKSYFDIPQNNVENRSNVQVRPTPAFYGQLCLLRGDQMECKSVTSTTTASPVESSTSSPSVKVTQPFGTNTTLTSNQCLDYTDQPHTWTLRITIRINTEIFEKIERIIRVIAYYITFAVHFWAQ